MVPARPSPSLFAQKTAIFRKQGGMLRMSRALKLGISRNALYGMRDAGIVEPLARGLYRLSSAAPLANPDLVTVAIRVPRGVLCLISALAYHDLTTEIPHEIQMAILRGSERPRIKYPPTRFFWFSGPAYNEGVETHTMDGVPVRIFSPEKTIADCFRHRNKLGLDVCIEALKSWREQRHKHLDALVRHARQLRVERTLRPYLQVLL
jgi:predicted transcriptional regulator of viral defense system